VTVSDDEEKVRAERARAIGLFRYQLIREAADAGEVRPRGRFLCGSLVCPSTPPAGLTLARLKPGAAERWCWLSSDAGAFGPSCSCSASQMLMPYRYLRERGHGAQWTPRELACPGL
jgi:putative transposase